MSTIPNIIPNVPSVPSMPAVPSIQPQLNIKMPNYVPSPDDIFIDKPKIEELDTNVPMPKPIIKCPTCEAQKKEQQAKKKLKDAKEKLDKELNKIVDAPQKAFTNAKKSFSKFINAFSEDDDENDSQLNPAVALRLINSLLMPVAEPLKSLPIDVVPGLNDLVNLIPNLLELANPSENQAEINAKVPKLPELSDEESSLVDDFGTAIQTMSTMFMFVLITIIIEMINKIIDLIRQVFKAVGLDLDKLPSPLDILVDLASLLPKIYKLVTNLPNKMKSSAKGIMRRKLQEIEALSQIDPLELLSDVNISCDNHPKIPEYEEFEDEFMDEEVEDDKSNSSTDGEIDYDNIED